VVGVDREEPLAAARGRYRAATLEFRALELMQLATLGERFDLVVSFQVIEHLPDPSGFLRGLADRVAPGGTLIVTTPNRLMSVSENPYHLREWTAPELLELARAVIPDARVLGMHGSPPVLAYERARGEQVQRILRLDPLGLRRLVPTAVVHFAFSRLARLVRRRVGAGSALPSVGAADFSVGGDDLDHALDLVILVEPAAR
jgi:SAM-dependent methyltransferase